MKNKYLFVFLLLAALSLAGFGFTRGYTAYEKQDGEELTIVTSFYPMQIAAMNVAGDCEGVTVECLSEPQTGCLHDYQLTPQDMILLSQADVFVVNGGGIESFLTEVAREYPDLVILDAGEGIFSEAIGDVQDPEEEGIHGEEHDSEKGEAHEGHHHEENAHAWMSISHYMQQIENICDGLSQVDPAHAAVYRSNRDAYLEQVLKVQEQAEAVKSLAHGRQIVIFHEAYEYLAEDLDMGVAGVLDLDEERQVSAGEIADIIGTIREHQIEILLAEELYGQDMGNMVEQETGCKVYYLDTLVRGQVRPNAWITGMQENLRILAEALEES